MSTSEILPTNYRGYFIDKETDPWRNKAQDNVRFSHGSNIDEEPGFIYWASDLDEAKDMIDDLIAEKEAKAESFQTKGALHYLITVMEEYKKMMDEFIAEHPSVNLIVKLPAEKESLNYKWTQWAKQKIENLK